MSASPSGDVTVTANSSRLRESASEFIRWSTPGSAFTGQAFHRVAQQVSETHLEQARIAMAKAAVARLELSAKVLAFDTTDFDTSIATLTPGEWTQGGHAKSKRADLCWKNERLARSQK